MNPVMYNSYNLLLTLLYIIILPSLSEDSWGYYVPPQNALLQIFPEIMISTKPNIWQLDDHNQRPKWLSCHLQCASNGYHVTSSVLRMVIMSPPVCFEWLSCHLQCASNGYHVASSVFRMAIMSPQVCFEWLSCRLKCASNGYHVASSVLRMVIMSPPVCFEWLSCHLQCASNGYHVTSSMLRMALWLLSSPISINIYVLDTHVTSCWLFEKWCFRLLAWQVRVYIAKYIGILIIECASLYGGYMCVECQLTFAKIPAHKFQLW